MREFDSHPRLHLPQIGNKWRKNDSLESVSSCAQMPPPNKPYRYPAIREKVPRFRNSIHGLDAETKRWIERIGYNRGAKFAVHLADQLTIRSY